jgi:hypothetical protein
MRKRIQGEFCFIVICMSFLYMNNMFAQEYDSVDKIDSLLQKVLYYDQKVREDYNHTPTKELSQKMERQDSINQAIVFPIIDSIIQNKINGLSDTSWRACFMVLQHAPFRIQLKYLDFVTEYFKKGYILNYEYMIFVDRIFASQRKTQPFGSQSARFLNGKCVFLPMWPKVKRDSLLLTIGINPASVQRKNGVFTFVTKVDEKKLSMFSSFQSQPPSVPDTIKENEEELVLDDDERGILLMVKSNPSFPVFCGVKVYIGGCCKGKTDEFGFSMFKVRKEDDIHTIDLVYPDGQIRKYSLKNFVEGQDYIIEGIE